MDLCIKTIAFLASRENSRRVSILVLMDLCIKTSYRVLPFFMLSLRFNPCFNGSMYKNRNHQRFLAVFILCFNPCFNGSMYKNSILLEGISIGKNVSILVLMDLCIKTSINPLYPNWNCAFQSLF